MEGKHGEAGSLYAGDCSHALFDLFIQSRESGVLLVADRSWFDLEQKHAVLVEAHIDICQIDQSAKKKAGADQQDQRERNLSDDQSLGQRTVNRRSA